MSSPSRVIYLVGGGGGGGFYRKTRTSKGHLRPGEEGHKSIAALCISGAYSGLIPPGLAKAQRFICNFKFNVC